MPVEIPDSAQAAAAALRPRVRGDVLTPGDGEYGPAREMWNALFDARPAAVVRCAGPKDVAAAVVAANRAGGRLSVKSTGHSYAGRSVCEGGLVVDVSGMDAVHVDAEARTARVGPGARWAAVDAAAQAHGLATTGATVSTVGVTGYTLGGGTGHLARALGLGLDNLRAAEVVLASGERVRASEGENADLFWALRGGGGNFGVVTGLELALHPVGPEVAAGQIVYPMAEAAAVLRHWRDVMAGAPDGLQCYPFFLRVPPVDPFPEALHGATALDFVVSYAGPVEEGLAAIDALRGAAEPALDLVGPTPYADLQRAFDAGMPGGLRWYSRAHYLRGLPDEAVDALVGLIDPLPSLASVVYLEPLGGAIGRVPHDATAYAHRAAPLSLHVFPGWDDPADDGRMAAWARGVHEAMAPYATGGVYVNLLGPDERARVPAAYGDHYPRLRELKRRYDPDNVFRSNHNVPPAADA
jgi:FAD/FMN-containing dehydrogenase